MTASLDPFDESTWSNEERHYFREIVDAALENRKGLMISNSRTEHAVYLINKFLLNAKKVVRLYSGNLARRGSQTEIQVYEHPQIINAVRGLLKRGVALQIVVQEPLDVEVGWSAEDHPIAQAAKEVERSGGLKGSVEIRRAQEKWVAWLKDEDFDCHWMTMDGHAHRLEVDTKQFKAYVNFWDEPKTKKLDDLFDVVLFSRGESLARVPAVA